MSNDPRWNKKSDPNSPAFSAPSIEASHSFNARHTADFGSNMSTSSSIELSSTATHQSYGSNNRPFDASPTTSSNTLSSSRNPPTSFETSPNTSTTSHTHDAPHNRAMFHQPLDPSSSAPSHPYLRHPASSSGTIFTPPHTRSSILNSHFDTTIPMSMSANFLHTPPATYPSPIDNMHSFPTTSSSLSNPSPFSGNSNAIGTSSGGNTVSAHFPAAAHTASSIPHSSFHTSTPFVSNIFPYTSHHPHLTTQPNTWFKLDEPHPDDFTFQYRAQRTKPSLTGEGLLQLQNNATNIPFMPQDATTYAYQSRIDISTPIESKSSSSRGSVSSEPLSTSPRATTRRKQRASTKLKAITAHETASEALFASGSASSIKKSRQSQMASKKKHANAFKKESEEEDDQEEISDRGGVEYGYKERRMSLEFNEATMAAKTVIQKSFESSYIQLRGERQLVTQLKRNGSILSLEHQPTEHQVKDFNIIPMPVIRLSSGAEIRTCDYVAAFLYCDENMSVVDPIFLAALNAKLVPNLELPFINLRVTKEMLKGRTKGFSFVIGFSFISDGRELETIFTSPFWLFSNVNQEGFPKSERDSYLRPQWRDATSSFSIKRKK